MGGLSDRPGQIGAHGQRHHARGHERRVAAARAPRTPAGRRGVRGSSPDGIVGLMQPHHLRHIRLAHDHRPGCPKPDDDLGVVLVGGVASGNPERRPQAAHGETLFDAHWHTAERQPRHARHLRSGRRVPRLHEGIEPAVCSLMPPHVVGERVTGLEPPRGHGLGDLQRRSRHVTRGQKRSSTGAAFFSGCSTGRTSLAHTTSPSKSTPITSTRAPGST